MVPALCLTPPSSPTTTLAPGHRYLTVLICVISYFILVFGANMFLCSNFVGFGVESHTNSKQIRVNYVFQAPPRDKHHLVTAKVQLCSYTLLVIFVLLANILTSFPSRRLQKATPETQNQIV